jgi:hypothetical protein
MSQVGFQPTTPTLERGKTVHALDRAATLIGATFISILKVCILPTERTCVFRMDFIPQHRYLVGLCSGDAICFL